MASARHQAKQSTPDARRRSELAKLMRTGASHEERSRAARELSQSRASISHAGSAKKGGSS